MLANGMQAEVFKPGGGFILLEATVLCYLLQCRLTTENDIATEKSELTEPLYCKSLKTLQYHEYTTDSLYKEELKLSTKGSGKVNTARGSVLLGSRETKAVQHLPDSGPRTKAWVVAGNAYRVGKKLYIFCLDIKHNFNWQRLFLPSELKILISSRHYFIYLRRSQSAS